VDGGTGRRRARAAVVGRVKDEAVTRLETSGGFGLAFESGYRAARLADECITAFRDQATRTTSSRDTTATITTEMRCSAVDGVGVEEWHVPCCYIQGQLSILPSS
jgi:hypothetical protein